MLKTVLRGVIDGVIDRALPSATPVERVNATEELNDRLIPILQHETNNEPWYRSRVTWGAIGSIALPLLGIIGVTSDIVTLDEFVAGGIAVGAMISGIVTLYGRWAARKPIGK